MEKIFSLVIALLITISLTSVRSADSTTGTEELNLKLAAGRAGAVKDILVKNHDIAADRIYTRTRLDINGLSLQPADRWSLPLSMDPNRMLV